MNVSLKTKRIEPTFIKSLSQLNKRGESLIYTYEEFCRSSL